VAAVSRGSLLPNAAAARLLAAADQPRLWDFVSRRMQLDRTAECRFVLADGSALTVSLEAVFNGHEVAGVMVRALVPRAWFWATCGVTPNWRQPATNSALS
jgi:hypothetical protein